MELTQEEKDRTLKNFMEEFFEFDGLVECGFFKEGMRGDYKAQAEKVCFFFGYDSVYEYGTTTIPCHISFEGKRPEGFEDFVTVIKPWYEE